MSKTACINPCFLKMPVLLGEKYVVLFANNSLKMSVLLDVSSGKVCSIVCLTVTLRKYCYCLMHGKVCSIVWE